MSSTQTGISVATDEGTIVYPRSLLIIPPEAGNDTLTRGASSDSGRDEQSTPEPANPTETYHSARRLPSAPPGISTASFPTNTAVNTDESDTDFQSAYSISPRESYVEDTPYTNKIPTYEDSQQIPSTSHRERVLSTDTAKHSPHYTNLTSISDTPSEGIANSS